MSDASPPPEDPFRPMREAYGQAVEGWSKAMEQMVASEEFASASGEFLKRYVEMQETLRTASRAAAESVHFPTTDDLARLAQLVINVERKVDEVSDEAHAIAGRLATIEAALDELARRQAGPPDPPKAPTAKRAPARRRGKPSAGG
jgi:polyhydroxyalkanoic acid synthase PhaR subunit